MNDHGMESLELSLQELEPLEAPGWATWGGRIASAVTASVVYYIT